MPTKSTNETPYWEKADRSKPYVLNRHARKIRKDRGVGGDYSCDIRYTIPELKDILQKADYIWAFDPTRGRAEIVCLASLHCEVRLFENENVSLSFGLDGGGIGSVKLIPTDFVNGDTPY